MTKFIHIRIQSIITGELHPCGGTTLAYDYDPDSKMISYQFAQCSRKDNYNKKVGRTIASGRLDKAPHVFYFKPEGDSPVSNSLVCAAVINEFLGSHSTAFEGLLPFGDYPRSPEVWVEASETQETVH